MSSTPEGGDWLGEEPDDLMIPMLPGEKFMDYSRYCRIVDATVKDSEIDDPEWKERVLEGSEQLAAQTNCQSQTWEKVPDFVKQEWPHQRQEYRGRVKNFGRLMLYGLGSVAVLVGGTTLLAEIDGSQRPRASAIAARDVDALKALGICANDMRMEWAYDNMLQDPDFKKAELKIDEYAIETAELHNNPCVKNPDTTKLVQVGGGSSLLRGGLTSFVYANWPQQRRELAKQLEADWEGQEVTDSSASHKQDIFKRIMAGDVVYTAEDLKLAITPRSK